MSKIKTLLIGLNEIINRYVDESVADGSKDANSTSIFRDYLRMIDATELVHARAIGVLVLMMSSSDEPVSAAELRRFVENCERDFSLNLRINLKEHLKERGLPDIFDPNEKLREDIINDSL